MLPVDRQQALAVAMTVVGLVVLAAGGGLLIALVEGSSADEAYEARLAPHSSDTDAVDPTDSEVRDYRNLSDRTRTLFDGLYESLGSESFVRESVVNDRAWALENETTLSIGDTTYVRYEGRLYELTLDFETDPHGPSPVITVVFGGVGLALLVSGAALSSVGARRLRNDRRGA